jgi:hypothetical protein
MIFPFPHRMIHTSPFSHLNFWYRFLSSSFPQLSIIYYLWPSYGHYSSQAS